MVTEAVQNHPFTLLPQMNSKGFFTFDAVACSVYTESSPYTFLLIFDDL